MVHYTRRRNRRQLGYLPSALQVLHEMLCHFFPGAQDGYPLKNAPVPHFLKKTVVLPLLTPGQRYADLVRRLRARLSRKADESTRSR